MLCGNKVTYWIIQVMSFLLTNQRALFLGDIVMLFRNLVLPSALGGKEDVIWTYANQDGLIQVMVIILGIKITKSYFYQL